MGKKQDYRPVGYVVSAEGKKITQSKRHSKAKGYLKKAGEGSGRRIGLAPAIKSVPAIEEVSTYYSSESNRLGKQGAA